VTVTDGRRAGDTIRGSLEVIRTGDCTHLGAIWARRVWQAPRETLS